MYRLCFVLIFFCIHGIFGDYKDALFRRGSPSTNENIDVECIKDLLLVVDTSYSIGESDFNKNVIPFLKNLVTDPLLNVGEFGTHVGLILFSSVDKTKTKLHIGEIKDARKLEQYIGNLNWGSVSGGHTRTDLGLELANEEFKENNPQNHRSEFDDVVVLITDGEPRGKTDTLEQTRKYADMLKKKEVRIVTAGVGRQSEQPQFIKILKELATSPEFFLKAQFDKMDEILSTLVAKSCVQPGSCICKEHIIDVTIKPGEKTAVVDWPKPSYTCESGGEVTDEKFVVEPNLTPPHAFPRGNHVITYTYTLNGKVTFKCPISINVIGELCRGVAFDSSTQVCCCGTIHAHKPGHDCCGPDYFDTKNLQCCEHFNLVPIQEKCEGF